MKYQRSVITVIAVATCLGTQARAQRSLYSDDGTTVNLTISPNSLTFNATLNGAAPPAQTVSISAQKSTRFTATASTPNAATKWLTVSPSGTLNTNQKLTISASPSHLSAGTYSGQVLVVAGGKTYPVAVTLNITGSGLTVSPGSLSFSAPAGGAAPASQSVNVGASAATSFTAAVSVQNSSRNWLSISPTSNLRTPLTLKVSVNQTGLAAGGYAGNVLLTANGKSISLPVTLSVTSSGGGGGGGTTGNFTLIGWNDLGMHCQDGKDFSVFAVLPPFNTIHAHLIDSTGKLITLGTGYTVTYQAINDPLTNTLNTTSMAKSNFWQFASALGFGSLAPDTGLKGYSMPGSGNTPRAMTFTATDNTWTATGIPMMPYADAPQAPYPANYFPMMRLIARNSLGTAVASTDIVLPVSDEMNCALCHTSGTGSAAAKPVNNWVYNSDPAKDIKLNILRKHDDRFQSTALYQSAATQVGYSTAGLETTTLSKPVLCANCHATNALGLAGVAGIEAMTTAMHSLHANVIDPATSQTMNSSMVRDSCYRCHPGPNTKCLRGAMGSLTTSTGAFAIECQSCHGPMTNVAVATRQGWLDEPNCQSCHTGTATSNNGQLAYTSVFSSGTTVRVPVDLTFATNPNTPANGLSLYRFSKGHGGLQCESCHGSTHAEFATTNVNDNVQSTALQGHAGVLAECATCHGTMPSTVTGGPHGLHPIGSTWVSSHQDVADSNGALSCQPCHGVDYRGTILSKTLADRTLAGKSFPKGTVIGCYSCHNGPNGGG